MKKEEEIEPYYHEGLWFPKEDLAVFRKYHLDKFLKKLCGVATKDSGNDSTDDGSKHND